MRSAVGLILLAFIALASIGASDCGDSSAEEQRKKATEQRTETFDRAEKSQPIPTVLNFPLRNALIKFTLREDLVEHPWYIYILGDNANMLGFYVGQTVPINACNFLSSTEIVNSSESGKVVLTAPSLDGIFYGGGGSEGSCDAWFFFDYATDAMIVIRGLNYFVADQPLLIDAEPIKIKATP